MALKIDNKFIASPSFVIRSAEGQNLTLAVKPKLVGANYEKYFDVVLDPTYYALTGTDIANSGIAAVTPSVTNLPDANINTPLSDTQQAIYNFLNFLALNPAHISRLNFRASALAFVPTQLTICTPNLFTGQVEKQVINVTAASNMYQNQTDIITIDCDAYLCRNSYLQFTAAFSTNVQPTLNIDVRIDAYLSLEKAIIDNLRLLGTASGAAAAIQNVSAESDAVANVDEVADSAIQAINKKPLQSMAQKYGKANSIPTWDKGNR